MKISTQLQLVFIILVTFFSLSINAEVITAKPSHFKLELVAESELATEQVWKKLIEPKSWWQSDHTYSGDANNLSLDPVAGGFWREDWQGGSVLHGTVLNIQTNKLLRLSAPFGPLQEMAVETVWTISLTETDTGTRITFEFIANGNEFSALEKLAPAVNYVKGEALKSLAKSD